MIIIIVNLTWSSLFSQLSWLTLINTLCPFSTYCLGPPNTPSFPGFLILDLDAVNVSPFGRQHSIWLCQWRVLEECWRKNGILCLESVLSFLLVWCTARGHLPYQQRECFFVVFFCLFVCFPESIGSDGEQVVDALWWASVVPQQATSQRPDSCSPALAWGTSANITIL